MTAEHLLYCRRTHYTATSGVSSLDGGDYTVARRLFGSLEDLQYDNRTSTAGVSTINTATSGVSSRQ